MQLENVFPDLPKETLDQLKFIKEVYNSNVELLIKNNQDDDISAGVKYIPVIEKKSEYDATIDDIVHEMWHLNMKATIGIDRYLLGPRLTEMAINSSGTEYDKVFYTLYSVVQHFWFLKEIDDGFNPFDFIEKSFIEIKKFKCKDISTYEIHIYALHLIHFFMLNVKNGKGENEISILQNCESVNSIALELLTELQKFKSIAMEPEIIISMLKILWNIDTKIEIIQDNRTVTLEK